MSNIEWTTKTWNPIVGCTKVSKGCTHCYAEKMHARILSTGISPAYTQPFHLKVVERNIKIDEPRHWKKPQKVFVNSMSDFFHEKVSHEFRLKLYKTMVECPHHTFQILTKRQKVMEEFFRLVKGKVPKNIHIGVSVENAEMAYERIPTLLEIDLPVRFLSLEPLIGDVSDFLFLNSAAIKKRIHWMIVGGESGKISKVRPMNLAWAMKIADFCETRKIRYFFKQTGTIVAKQHKMQAYKGGDEREFHKLGDAYPIQIYRREYPTE